MDERLERGGGGGAITSSALTQLFSAHFLPSSSAFVAA